MKSSYQQNNYDELFSALVAVHKPKVIVECGVLNGFSLLAMVESSDPRSDIFAYDLFEDYEFKHGQQKEVQNLLDVNFHKNVKLVKQDAIEAARNHEDKSVDFLHIDISNHYENLAKMFDVWMPKVKVDGLMLFEGGSKERDNVEWMKKHKKRKISKFIYEYLVDCYMFEFVTMLPFPSLTICRKLE